MSAHVLLVEDDEFIRESLVEIIEAEGYQVAIAANGREALDYVMRTDVLPAVILLDLMMPVMDGHEFIAALRKLEDPARRDLPVIVLTASRDRPSGHRIIATLRKPIDLKALFTAMREAAAT